MEGPCLLHNGDSVQVNETSWQLSRQREVLVFVPPTPGAGSGCGWMEKLVSHWVPSVQWHCWGAHPGSPDALPSLSCFSIGHDASDTQSCAHQKEPLCEMTPCSLPRDETGQTAQNSRRLSSCPIQVPRRPGAGVHMHTHSLTTHPQLLLLRDGTALVPEGLRLTACAQHGHSGGNRSSGIPSVSV